MNTFIFIYIYISNTMHICIDIFYNYVHIYHVLKCNITLFIDVSSVTRVLIVT